MVPTPSIMDAAYGMLESISRRNLGNAPADISPPYTDQEKYDLQVLAVTFSAISVASAMLAFYWFRRMRRSFRHDLIMFLIQSDMFKALWLMIYPIVVFTSGPVPSSSLFCQASGFFISLGVEASDFAVLMIAIHTSLYVFKPRNAPGRGGLYPYRYAAFVAWVVFPVLMASLAFVNNINGYTSQETYCYLPVRPFWYSLALSWIPRYIIFIIIIVVYASLYLYVKYKFQKFNKGNDVPSEPSQDSTAADERGDLALRLQKRHTLPATPPLAYHGLISGSRSNSFRALPARQYSISTTEPFSAQISRSSTYNAGVSRSAQWMPSLNRQQSEMSEYSSPDPFLNFGTTGTDNYSNHQIESSTAATSTPHSDPTSSGTSWTTFAERFISPESRPYRSLMGIVSFLRRQSHHPASPCIPSTPVGQLELVNSRGENLALAEMMRTRYRIRRQLRHMFIYPLVYIGMWIIPFVAHAMQYDDKYALNPPFILTAVSTIIINSQCAVDCWLFSTREKPWAHISGSKGGFWESFMFWKGERRHRQKKGPGKSEAELTAEAEVAYQRRDEEIAARQLEVESLHGSVSAISRGCRAERSWWDEPEGLDGTMTAVQEETADGLDDQIPYDTGDKKREEV